LRAIFKIQNSRKSLNCAPTDFTSALVNVDIETDAQIRAAALQWLENAKHRHPRGEIPAKDTSFHVFSPKHGNLTISAFTPTGQGIWKPRQLQACLSIVTSSKHIYEDLFDEESGVLSYKYFDGDYDHRYNKSLRLAMEHRLPILYFRGVRPGLYLVDVALALEEDPNKDGVLLRVLPDDVSLFMRGVKKAIEEPEMVMLRHSTFVAQRRLRQAEFRQRVMKAYSKQCAVCNLKSEPLLDAAHIIPHSQSGQPEVPNGLSLCKIHHSAYDQNMLGISPDYLIHVNSDMLSQRDGPMLRHGFQERNREKIYIPRKKSDYTDRDKIGKRFEEFKQAC